MGVSSINKKIIFRVDSNKTIASGHVMRCLSLADALCLKGAQCVFVSSDGDMASVIMDRGHGYVNLHSQWDDLGADFPAIYDLLNEVQPHFIIVDTYSATEKYISDLSRYCPVGYLGSKHLASSDLSLLVNYSTDIDHSFYEQAYDSRRTRLLLGPQYAPLRSQFWDVPPKMVDDASSVLITLGNSENRVFLETLLREIESRSQLDSLDVTLLAGRYFSQSNWIEAFAESRGKMRVLSGVSDMAELMQEVDIAISACGTTVYELGACSVPTVGFALVGEQVPSAESLAKLGAISYAGTAFDMPLQCAQSTIDALCSVVVDSGLRASLSSKIHGISDGRGALRIANAIFELLGVDD